MFTDNHYQNSTLLFSYLIVSVDGIVDDREMAAIRKICEQENISSEDLLTFLTEISTQPERQIFNLGHEEISHCTDEEKTNVFGWLHRLSEADGDMHVKEVRFLLYSIKRAGIEFEDVVKASANLPSLL